MLADEEMPCTLRVQKTMQVSSTCVSAVDERHTDGATRPVTIPDYLQNSHSRCEWELPVVHPSSMQLLTAEQALAAAASGSAVVHAAVCTRQR